MFLTRNLVGEIKDFPRTVKKTPEIVFVSGASTTDRCEIVHLNFIDDRIY